jgi:hypothetical protein
MQKQGKSWPWYIMPIVGITFTAILAYSINITPADSGKGKGMGASLHAKTTKSILSQN